MGNRYSIEERLEMPVDFRSEQNGKWGMLSENDMLWFRMGEWDYFIDTDGKMESVLIPEFPFDTPMKPSIEFRASMREIVAKNAGRPALLLCFPEWEQRYCRWSDQTWADSEEYVRTHGPAIFRERNEPDSNPPKA
jgi:hypothetical protein